MAKKNNAPNHISVFKSIAFGTRGVSNGMAAVVIGYITYYCTNKLGMAPGLVGILLLTSKIFDGVTDLFAGVLVDKTNTRWGKARPYELSIVGVWLSTWLMFSVPDLGLVGQCIWVFTTYTFANSVFVTLLGASESVYYARAFTDDIQRSKTIAVTGFMVTIGCGVVAVGFPILMDTIGSTKAGWSSMVLMFALPMAIIGLGRMIFVPEIVNAETSQNTAQKLDKAAFVRALKNGKYIYITAAALLLNQMIYIISSTVNTYYFDYIVGDLSALGIVNMMALITPFLLFVMPAVLKKITVQQVIFIGSVLGIVGCLVKWVAGANMPLLILSAILCAISTMPLSYYGALMTINCMDYNEWKTGDRVEGLFGSLTNFCGKIGSAFSSSLVGFLMGATGFVGENAVQTAEANRMIVGLNSWIPAIFFVLIIIVTKFFDVEKKLPQIKAELEERKAKSIS